MTPTEILNYLYAEGAVLSVKNGELSISAPDDILSDTLLETIKTNKSALIDLISLLDSQLQADLSVQQVDRTETYDCDVSLAQQRMLFMEALSDRNSYYNIPVAYKISGILNLEALKKSLLALIKKHHVLRAIYKLHEDVFVQRVCEPREDFIAHRSLINKSNKDQELSQILVQDANYAFNLEHELPIRVSLIQISQNDFVLSINIHHIAADGWSARTIVRDISEAYAGYNQNLSIPEDKVLQYADYTNWQAKWLNSDLFLAAKTYWLHSLSGAPLLHSLPTDFSRPGLPSIAGDIYRHKLSKDLSSRIDTCARQYCTTSFVLFQAIFAAWLARYSDETDIVFGTVSANRQPVDFVNTVGLFANTLVLRYLVDDDISFIALLQQAIKVSDGAFRFQQFPFDYLVDELQPARSLGYNPLVQIMLVMQEQAAGLLTLENAAVTMLDQFQSVAKFDLTLHVSAAPDGYSFAWEYKTALFKQSTIENFSYYIENLLEQCLQFPERKVAYIAFEREQQLLDVIDAKSFGTPLSIYELFEKQLDCNPHAIAICEGEVAVSYCELAQMVNSVTQSLSLDFHGVTSSMRIGVCMEKSLELIVSLLTIFKLGAVYVPMDPHYPKERLEYMVRDSGIKLLLSTKHTQLLNKLDGISSLRFIDDLMNNKLAPDCRSTYDIKKPAYIIYTSGSTGLPKGVLVSQESLFYSLCSNKNNMDINQNDLMPTIGSQAFGVSLLEILLPLISGGSVQILNRSQVIDIELFIDKTKNVSVLHAVPSLMRRWLEFVIAQHVEHSYTKLRLLLVGGEAVPADLLKKIKNTFPHVRLLELYGMTESAVVCSSYEVNDELSAHYCIGKPNKNSQFYVLNRHGRQQPVGVPGELHIGGLSLADEYINQPEMTAEKFIKDDAVTGGYLYKTGDRVRLLSDGNYEFLGRVDHQVSLRGVRIELGEVEALALSVQGVKQAVASVMTIGEEKALILYYTMAHKENTNSNLTDAIREYFKRHLPDYMRPSVIQYIDSFPLNANGKIDRKNLPEIQSTKIFATPETEIEQRMLKIWNDILQIDEICIDSNFFDIGGNSLMASKLAIKIRAEFSILFPMVGLFEAQSIRSCAKYVEKLMQEHYARLMVSDLNDSSCFDDELII